MGGLVTKMKEQREKRSSKTIDIVIYVFFFEERDYTSHWCHVTVVTRGSNKSCAHKTDRLPVFNQLEIWITILPLGTSFPFWRNHENALLQATAAKLLLTYNMYTLWLQNKIILILSQTKLAKNRTSSAAAMQSSVINVMFTDIMFSGGFFQTAKTWANAGVVLL